MYDFISTENIKQTKKISSLVDSLLPNFIREEGENFAIFLKEYYKWLEIHELVVEDYVRNEFKIITEVEDLYISLENDEFGIDRLILESDRKINDTFIINETITGRQSGATAIVDRNMLDTDFTIYIKNVSKIDFIPGEEIIGSSNRITAVVNRFTKNPLFESRSFLDQIDIDGSTTSFLSDFLKNILLNIPKNSSVDRKILAKHIVDVYRSRGTERSYQYLFKTIYGVLETEVKYPKEQIIKSSSGVWEKLDRIRLSSEYPIEYFEGRTITGVQSKSTAIVNRVFRFAAGSFFVTEVSLRERSGNFVIGETVYTDEVDGTRGFGEIQGLISDIEIINPGTNYAVGDIITITGGGGIEATAKVAEIKDGALSEFYIFDGGDGYTLTDNVSVNNFGTGGSGFAGRIVDVDYSFTHSFIDSYIIDYAHVFLSDEDYGFKKSDEIIVSKDTRLIDAFKFIRLNTGTISDIKTVVVGTGYEELPTITSKNDKTYRIYDSVSLRILNFERDPDDIFLTPTITGNFQPSEKITTSDGRKIGTFYGLVKDVNDFEDPYRARYSPIRYFGAYGKGVNDLTINCVSYPSTTEYPVVYDLQITVPGKVDDNKFKFRRNVNSISLVASSEYNPTEFTITGGQQLLEFDVVSITRELTLATVRTSFNHGLEVGQKVIITGATPDDYNGEHTVAGVTDKSFTYSVSDTLTTPASGIIRYNEGIYVKFGLQFDHDLTDRYLFSAIDFENRDIVKGSSSAATAEVKFTGSVSSFGGSLGNNAVLGIEPGNTETGSIKRITITNPGVGFTTSPTATLPGLGSGDAELRVKIGAVSRDDGRYIVENGFLSDSKKIIDSDYYQDFSYSIKNNKQLNEYSELVKKLLHPSGLKLFGEFTPETRNLNLSFDDFVLFEDGDSVLYENSNNDVILTEKYTDPSYKTYGKLLKPSQSTVTVKGGQNFLTGTNINTDYASNSSLIIDDEQLFTVTYGDLLLETPLKGKIKGDSSNTINRFIISKPTSNFKTNDIVIQVHDDDSVATANVLSQHLDTQNNYILVVHSTNGVFDDKTIISSGDDISQLILEDKSDLIYEDKSKLMLENSISIQDVTIKYSTVSSVSSNVVFGGTDNSEIELKSITGNDLIATVETINKHELKIGDFISVSNVLTSEETKTKTTYNGTNWVVFDVLSDYKFTYKTRSIASPSTPYIANATLNRKEGTDFQNDLKINDVVTSYFSFNKFKVLDIINSSCLIANTSFNTSDVFNLITEDNYNFITQNNETFFTESTINLTSYFNEENIEHLITEGTVRGTTSANGISDGSFEIISYDSDFHNDLSVGDVIRLSSNDKINAKIKSIIDRDRLITEDNDVMILNSVVDPVGRILLETGDTQTIIVDKSLGNGKSDQTIVLLSAKKIEFEEDSTKITLNNVYDGSNNFMYVVDRKGDYGQLLLEDGVPRNSPLYVGNVSNEGKLMFEEYSTFNNQEIRKIT